MGNATSRAILFASRDPRAKFYPDRQWFTAFIAGSSEFADAGERILDARTMFHYYATGTTPAMTYLKPGTGSAYAVAARDSQGRYFDGSKAYRITLPGPIPAAQFWSFTVYDNQTRSMLESAAKTGRSGCCAVSGHSTWALLKTGHSFESANIFSLAGGCAAGTVIDHDVGMRFVAPLPPLPAIKTVLVCADWQKRPGQAAAFPYRSRGTIAGDR